MYMYHVSTAPTMTLTARQGNHLFHASSTFSRLAPHLNRLLSDTSRLEILLTSDDGGKEEARAGGNGVLAQPIGTRCGVAASGRQLTL